MPKFVKGLYFSSWVIIVTSFILKLFRSDLFLLIDNNEFLISINNFVYDSPIFDFISHFTLYSISWYLTLMIISKDKIKFSNLLILLPLYTLIFFLSGTFWYFKYTNILKIIAEFTIAAVYGKLKGSNVLNAAKVFLISALYQAVSVFIRGVEFTTIYTITVALLLNIDYYFLLITFYIKERYNEQLAELYFIFPFKRSEGNGIPKIQKSDDETVQDEQVDRIDRILRPIFLIGSSIIQIGIVLLVGYLINGTIINMAYIILSFLISRCILVDCWHDKSSMIRCTLVSAISFGICARLALPLCYTLLINVFLGGALGLFMYKLHHWTEQANTIQELESEVEALKLDLKERKQLDLNGMTKDEIKNEYNHLTDWEISILYDTINRGSTTMKQIAKKYNYSVMQVYRIINRIKQGI